MRTFLVTALAGTLVATSSGVAQQAKYPVAPWMNRACPTEESSNCYWDAQHRGDHHGDSFYVRHIPNTRLVCVLYPGKPKLDYCVRVKP